MRLGNIFHLQLPGVVRQPGVAIVDPKEDVAAISRREFAAVADNQDAAGDAGQKESTTFVGHGLATTRIATDVVAPVTVCDGYVLVDDLARSESKLKLLLRLDANAGVLPTLVGGNVDQPRRRGGGGRTARSRGRGT